MTNEELEQEVKRLEEQLTELRIKILESKGGLIPYKPYEVEVPEDLEEYYILEEGGDVLKAHTYSEKWRRKTFIRGLVFETREQAEQFDKERILINKMNDWAKKHNGDWESNWSNFHEIKHYVTYKKEDGEFDMNFCRTFRHFIKLPYFKSKEIAKLFIDEFGDEIEEVFC